MVAGIPAGMIAFKLRVDAARAMTDGVFSKEVTFPVIITEDPTKDHKKAFLKMQKLGKTVRDYLLLGTQYGDVQGDHEPVRRDWFQQGTPIRFCCLAGCSKYSRPPRNRC